MARGGGSVCHPNAHVCQAPCGQAGLPKECCLTTILVSGMLAAQARFRFMQWTESRAAIWEACAKMRGRVGCQGLELMAGCVLLSLDCWDRSELPPAGGRPFRLSTSGASHISPNNQLCSSQSTGRRRSRIFNRTQTIRRKGRWIQSQDLAFELSPDIAV